MPTDYWRWFGWAWRGQSAKFNYFSARDFEPELWRGEYPNPAFGRMTEADGAWMARILARFDDQLVQAAVEVGRYDAASERFLVTTLVARRDAILKRYLTRASPIADISTDRDGFCGTDLARQRGLVPRSARFSVRARVGAAGSRTRPAQVTTGNAARVCVSLAPTTLSKALPDDDAERYRVIELDNGQAASPLRVHLYELGAERGFRLAGVER